MYTDFFFCQSICFSLYSMCKEFWGPEKKPCTPLYLKGDLEVSKYPNSLTTIGHHHSLVFSYKIQPKNHVLSVCTSIKLKIMEKN